MNVSAEKPHHNQFTFIPRQMPLPKNSLQMKHAKRLVSQSSMEFCSHLTV